MPVPDCAPFIPIAPITDPFAVKKAGMRNEVRGQCRERWMALYDSLRKECP